MSNNEEIRDRETDLVSFIKKFYNENGYGPRSEDLIKEFIPKLWSSKNSLFTHLGKLLDKDKLDKKADPKKAPDRYSRYYISKNFEKEATKITLSTDLREKELHETEHQSKQVFDFFFDRIKKQVDVVRRSGWNRKLRGEKGKFYGNFYAKFMAKKYSKYIKVNISYPKGQKPPNLDVDFKREKKTQGLEVLLSYFTDVAGKYQNEVGIMFPFHILLSYDPPVENVKELRQAISSQLDSLYQKWLLTFEQKESVKKKEEFTLELYENVLEIHKRREKALKLN